MNLLINFSGFLDVYGQKKVRYSYLLPSFTYDGSVPVYFLSKGSSTPSN